MFIWQQKSLQVLLVIKRIRILLRNPDRERTRLGKKRAMTRASVLLVARRATRRKNALIS